MRNPDGSSIMKLVKKWWKVRKRMECDTCANYCYDEEYEEYICDANMDEDDLVRFLGNQKNGCPYYRNGDEYQVVRKQM